ncbi:MAG: DUF3780 domain-containing protein [Desulfobacterales bacterium]|nr:DUF3780 domain-containing protein [Desulfobacterales bacterium]
MSHSNTIDFGAPEKFGMHHFYVDIPIEPNLAVSIYEDFGFDSDETKREITEKRVVLARELWTKIKDEARKDFNDRLKAKKQSTGTWTTGKIKLDRFLGRELCVLAWAAEHATQQECEIICQKWRALRPEERWWLYSKTSSEAGMWNQKERGWRKALYCALSDGMSIKVPVKINPKLKKIKGQEEKEENLLLF